MPKVPRTPIAVRPGAGPDRNEIKLTTPPTPVPTPLALMAAADMHSMGRLVEKPNATKAT